jgi:uncharacterized protein (TIGR00290 family)
MKKKVVLLWSGGKDSMLALHAVRENGEYEVVALVTTMTAGIDRISMHGVRREWLERQAAALGVPLDTFPISQGASNTEYEAKLGETLQRYKKNGIDSVLFGDLFLEDLRKYREDLLAKWGMKCLFPIWTTDTKSLAKKLVDLGYKTIVICVDLKALDRSFAGRVVDEAFLRELPPSADPCGENGEFHTFVFDGPGFRQPVKCSAGAVTIRDRFCFCDLIPSHEAKIARETLR